MLKHVVFADPNNQEAKNLEADAFEQMGYQAESATWRGFYLSGAKELRDGAIKKEVGNTASPDVVGAMSVDLLLDYAAVRLNSDRAAGKNIAINLNVADTNERYGVTVENSVLNYRLSPVANPDLTVTMSRLDLLEVFRGAATLDQKISDGKAKAQCNTSALGDLVSLTDNFNFWFNIVTPNEMAQ